MEQQLLSLFTNKTAHVIIVGNKSLNEAIVTPLLDRTTGKPKVDARGVALASIMLQQENTTMNGGFMNVRNRVAFITGTEEALNKLVGEKRLIAGMPIAGKIVIEESLVPFWPNQSAKVIPPPPNSPDVPIREVGVNLQDKFYPVYMRQRYTENMNEQDSLIRNPQELMMWMEKNKSVVDVTKLGKFIGQKEETRVPTGTGSIIPDPVGS